MTVHKHAEMIKAKADDMELVVLVKNDEWCITESCDDALMFFTGKEYFLCLPQRKEACLHWLNGGEIEFNSEFSDGWTEYEPIKVWGIGSIFMQDDYQIRIKPRKEKCWIVAHPRALASMMYFESEELARKAVQFSTGEFKGGQVIEIEVEV